MATQEASNTEISETLPIGTLAAGEPSAINPPIDLRGEPSRLASGGNLVQVFDYNTGTAHVIGVYMTLEEAQDQIESYELFPAQLIVSMPVSCFRARD